MSDSIDIQSSAAVPAAATISDGSAEPAGQHSQHAIPPSEFVFQLILEQFWGDGVSKREIRSVYTTANDANAACQDYLLRTWPRDQFSLYEIGTSPQRPELSKVSAQINGDRFHVWIERHPWEGILDFSSKAIAKRAGKGPNAYILQRTIKDASGGKRRSTTRGIYATRRLAKQALAQDQPPSEWSSNQGYVLEPGGEYAHAQSPSGKTAWLFIEVRPLYMSYSRLDQEEYESSNHLGTSAQNPISLDHGDDGITSISDSPSTLLHSIHLDRPSLENPFSPMQTNPDEAGAFVFLVLQLKTIPYTPPILTVEAVAYEIEVANRFGVALLEGFGGPEDIFEPVFRDDGCLQGTVEKRSRDEGLTVWVEKRAVVLGDEAMDFDLVSEHESIHSHRDPTSSYIAATAAITVAGDTGIARRKREELEGGFESIGRQKVSRTQESHGSTDREDGGQGQTNDSAGLSARYKIVSIIYHHPEQGTDSTDKDSSSVASHRAIIDSFEDLATALVSARMRFYGSLGKLDITTVDINDALDSDDGADKTRTIQARSRTNPLIVLQEITVEDSPDQ
ncbi:hypothetical protein BG011_000083 [Mortierella polycephala]|uniref:Uncharacterized protein n=1 Tax=Mortierella polycephala TaxID=41804 RepID=A0A9P6Q7R6_9FUNG|nr:hypothetical protein BG011_000083 [Mortierella polycephala]